MADPEVVPGDSIDGRWMSAVESLPATTSRFITLHGQPCWNKVLSAPTRTVSQRRGGLSASIPEGRQDNQVTDFDNLDKQSIQTTRPSATYSRYWLNKSTNRIERQQNLWWRVEESIGVEKEYLALIRPCSKFPPYLREGWSRLQQKACDFNSLGRHRRGLGVSVVRSFDMIVSRLAAHEQV